MNEDNQDQEPEQQINIEVEVEPNCSKIVSIETLYVLDFLTNLLGSKPQIYENAMKRLNALNGKSPLTMKLTPLCKITFGNQLIYLRIVKYQGLSIFSR